MNSGKLSIGRNLNYEGHFNALGSIDVKGSTRDESPYSSFPPFSPLDRIHTADDSSSMKLKFKCVSKLQTLF